MINLSQPLSKFRVSEDNLSADPTVEDAYVVYCAKRFEFGEARKALNEAMKKLHDLLDGPLRLDGLIPEGKDWTFKEDDDDGLCIQVWSEPKQRGRKKPEVPFRQISFPAKRPKAA
jgi:hypothetical protein